MLNAMVRCKGRQFSHIIDQGMLTRLSKILNAGGPDFSFRAVPKWPTTRGVSGVTGSGKVNGRRRGVLHEDSLVCAAKGGRHCDHVLVGWFKPQ